jgi:hypothetical protein
MGALRTGRVLSAALVWRSVSVTSAGRTLARTLVGGSEQDRTIAGMALVQAGPRSVPLIAESVTVIGASVTTVRVLADIDDPAARSVLRRIAEGRGPAADLAAELAGGDPA